MFHSVSALFRHPCLPSHPLSLYILFSGFSAISKFYEQSCHLTFNFPRSWKVTQGLERTRGGEGVRRGESETWMNSKACERIMLQARTISVRLRVPSRDWSIVIVYSSPYLSRLCFCGWYHAWTSVVAMTTPRRLRPTCIRARIYSGSEKEIVVWRARASLPIYEEQFSVPGGYLKEKKKKKKRKFLG